MASVRVDRFSPYLPQFSLLGDASDGVSNADTPSDDVLNGDSGSDFLANKFGTESSDGTCETSN